MRFHLRSLTLGLGLVLALAAPALADDPETTAAAANPIDEWDPAERINRTVFRFNDGLDRWVLEPAARGWDTVLPDPVERSVQNFFWNLRFPVDFVNALLQAKPRAGAITLARFMANTSFGFVGLFDPATGWGLPRQEEDFGQTLGVWGVPGGPFLVLPVFGPSNVRDTVGFGVDGATTVVSYFVNTWIWFGAGIINTINTRALYLEQIANARSASLDYYAFARNAYLQRRAALIRDEAHTTREVDDDLYGSDFDPVGEERD